MVIYFSCSRSWFGLKAYFFFFFFFFKIFIYTILLQLFTIPRIITTTTTVVPYYFQGQLWGGFPSANTMNLVSFSAFSLLNRFLHVQKIIIFIVVFWKVCNIPWKWHTIVNICLFSYFNSTFYINQQQWSLQKLKPST